MKDISQLLRSFSEQHEYSIAGITIFPAKEMLDLHAPPFPTTMACLLLIEEEFTKEELEKITKILTVNYSSDIEIKAVCSNSDESFSFPLQELSSQSRIEAFFLPVSGQYTSMEAFQEIVAHLRSPEGCPWDREQTHKSLRPFILEETYEMIDALDRGDLQGVKEELGDVLLQIFLHAQIAVEEGDFRLGDVLESISQKMIRRHPHVFANVSVEGDVSKVLRNWQEIKEEERRDNGEPVEKGILDGVPKSMSALLQAQSYQGRAACVGFDWASIDGVLDKVEEEIQEIREAENLEERAGEIGDLFFALVNLTRWLNLDAESTLRKTNEKFRKRFAYVEKRTRETNQSLTRMSLEEMDQFWDEAKKNGI
ncbi:MAG: nucleoside triphosphate pyrophosphohydrolase [Anaerolineaceae bacterium]|nr:nucleoside triphosphate pyrophosphohydrolase [Anaerolineaceae bacterium]